MPVLISSRSLGLWALIALTLTFSTGYAATLNFSPGWNQMSSRVPITTAETFANPDTVTSIWAWQAGKWAVYLPGEVNPGSYASSKGFAALAVIAPGEGFWLKAKTAASLTVSGVEASATTLSLSKGWNLKGLLSPYPIQAAVLLSSVSVPVSSVWKWQSGNWAVRLPYEATSVAYASSKGFIPLTTIAPGEGFWLNAFDAGEISLPTPPFATTAIDVVTNLDSRKKNEVDEDRLFANWNGTNVASQPSTSPIEPSKYEYITSITIYDSEGASHDITFYFDRTTKDNQWEFLVTCEPSEDQRVLTFTEQSIYAPDTRYNYKHHQGAGALMYGTIQFDNSGNISQVDAFRVPPDGQVDPAKSDNRILFEAGSSYFSFPTNFTGASNNLDVQLNFGATYGGWASTIRQTLVSDGGGRAIGLGGDVSAYVTSVTPWSKVADSNGNSISQGDLFVFDGYRNTGVPVHFVYTVDLSEDVQYLLTQLGNAFGATASINAVGRLRLGDNVSGKSSMYVTKFMTVSGNNSYPFGMGHQQVQNAWSVSSGAITSNGSSPVSVDTTNMVGLEGSPGPAAIQAGDTFTFSGTRIDGTALVAGPATTFTVGAGSTVQDLLAFIRNVFGDNVFGAGAQASLDQEGMLRVVDTTGGGNLVVTVAYTSVTSNGANPFGIAEGGPAATLIQKAGETALVDITTSKRMAVSGGRGLSTNTGDPTAITAATQWGSVYDNNTVAVPDQSVIEFKGTTRDGMAVDSKFTVTWNNLNGPGTVQDLLDQLQTDFACQAKIDSAGRLVLTDWVSDTVSAPSLLGVSSIDYWGPGGSPALYAGGTIFGTTAFDFIPADIGTEDGSQQGDVVTTVFQPEALSTTQYANSSTTIFQNQNGSAAVLP